MATHTRPATRPLSALLSRTRAKHCRLLHTTPARVPAPHEPVADPASALSLAQGECWVLAAAIPSLLLAAARPVTHGACNTQTCRVSCYRTPHVGRCRAAGDSPRTTAVRTKLSASGGRGARLGAQALAAASVRFGAVHSCHAAAGQAWPRFCWLQQWVLAGSPASLARCSDLGLTVCMSGHTLAP